MEQRTIAVGSDHGGVELKRDLCASLVSWGWDVEDVGCATHESVDYPDFALAVAARVASGAARFGVLVCGTGIGMSIAANKVKGIRAALCQECYSAKMARAHNDANVLCLGGRVVGVGVARAVLAAFLEATFEGGRHQRRLDRIACAEGGTGGRST